MKPYIITVGIAVLVVGGVFYHSENGGEVTYQRPQISATSTEAVIEEERIPAEWEREAQEAYDAVIQRNEWEKELADLEAWDAEQKRNHEEMIAGLEAAHKEGADQRAREIADLEKKLGVY